MTFKEQLNALSAVKFPLILAVVCVHVQNSPIPMTFDWFYVKFWGEVVGRIGVPLFFCISGIMFFCNVERKRNVLYFIENYWKGKILRRLRTLIIPYILWNMISLVFFILKDDLQLSLTDFFKAFWNFRTDGYWFFPVNGVFWFIRDLFIVSLCSPLIYLLLQKITKFTNSGGGVIFAIIFVFILSDNQFPLNSLFVAFAFFFIGSFIGMNRVIIIDALKKYTAISIIAFGVLSIVYLYLFYNKYSYVLGNMLVVVGMVAFVNSTYRLPVIWRRISLPSLSMFIFASHPILRFFAYYLLGKFQIEYLWLDYTLRVLLTVLLCYSCYFIGCRIFPKITSLLIGGR